MRLLVALVVVLLAAVVSLAAIAYAAQSARDRATTAVCSTDADCAQWEVDHHIPEADRCHGGPCSAR